MVRFFREPLHREGFQRRSGAKQEFSHETGLWELQRASPGHGRPVRPGTSRPSSSMTYKLSSSCPAWRKAASASTQRVGLTQTHLLRFPARHRPSLSSPLFQSLPTPRLDHPPRRLLFLLFVQLSDPRMSACASCKRNSTEPGVSCHNSHASSRRDCSGPSLPPPSRKEVWISPTRPPLKASSSNLWAQFST